MIKCNKRKTTISGNLIIVARDLINIIISVRKLFSNKMSEEHANKCIATCVRLAYATDENRVSLEKELAERFRDGFEQRSDSE